VLDLLAADRRLLAAVVDGLPRYAMIKRKLDLARVGGRGAVAAMVERVAARFAAERVDRSDGVRVDFADGWVHVRASNTEPIARLIAEAGTRERAEALLAEVARAAGAQIVP
jgi:phosphomannomutase